MPPVLVTGAAGFIGYHLARHYLDAGRAVVGLDNLNGYYDVGLKLARLARLGASAQFSFVRADIVDAEAVGRLFAEHRFDLVVHLAAQAGVRHSIHHPLDYVRSNVEGFTIVLEACRRHGTGHLVYASSSSVYGANTRMPFSAHAPAGHPLSLYGASKRTNELFAHSYSHLFGLPTTGLRFFTVYGPWGRPDMALFLFADAIMAGRPITLFNDGRMERDFTYVDDIVEAVARIGDRPAAADPAWSGRDPDPATSAAPYRLYNIGNNDPVPLMRLIEVLEACLGRTAVRTFAPMQAGDVPATYAEIDDLGEAIGFRPSTSIEDGVARFVAWYRDYRGL